MEQQPQQSVRGYRTGEDFLLAMIADLADWLAFMHDCPVAATDPEAFFAELDSGVLLCRHAVMVQAAAVEYFAANASAGSRRALRAGASTLSLPEGPPSHRVRAPAGSFIARDNIACFIAWCRRLGLPNCLLFETEDLVGRKNARSVVLCLLELARVGAKFGMEVPDLVHFEQEIDAEMSSTDSGLASPSNSLQSVPEQTDAVTVQPAAAAAAAASSAAVSESPACPSGRSRAPGPGRPSRSSTRASRRDTVSSRAARLESWAEPQALAAAASVPNTASGLPVFDVSNSSSSSSSSSSGVTAVADSGADQPCPAQPVSTVSTPAQAESQHAAAPRKQPVAQLTF